MPDYEIRPKVRLQAEIKAWELRQGEPAFRPLRVYAVDPSVSKNEGCIATVNVPYEPLQPGPVGNLFEVECADDDVRFAPLDLESARVLIHSGLAPAIANPAFHHQMVYAVASSIYATFRSALGRLIAWNYEDVKGNRPSNGRLLLRPHVRSEGANACYDRERCEIRFGYTKDLKFAGVRQFACLSHDIIAHEMTHALIDGLRSKFTIPTNSDVLGFHEGLSDLVAVFHHFLYPDVLVSQFRKFGPSVESSRLLTAIAENFGLTTIGVDAVRIATDDGDKQEKLRYRDDLEAHQLGSVLVTAVFEAFSKVFRRKTERYIRLAGPQVPGFWSEDLIRIMAEKAARLARQFLNVCVRAIDYCPPVDLRLGEYLRALITADAQLVPDDPWGYRETLIQCFAERGIYPAGAMALSEDALLWRPPDRHIPPIAALSFSSLRFNGDPSVPASAEDLENQARALGRVVTQHAFCDEFGLLPPGTEGADPPSIQSIRTARRIGPDGQVVFDLVAEVTQRRMLRDREYGLDAKLVGGSTIVIGPKGEVRFVISKSISRQDRVDRQFEYQRKHPELWETKQGAYRLAGDSLGFIHRGLKRLA